MTKSELQLRDQTDPLRHKREAFYIPQGLIYLDGNSLGVLPKHVPARLEDTIRREWGTDLIRSWNKNGWMDQPLKVGDKIGQLIGAEPGEVVAADSTSINLFKVLLAALKMRPERRVIVSDIDNFPTDLYIAQGIREMLGTDYELRFVPKEQLAEAIDDGIAVFMQTQVDYRTGYLYDMPALTAKTHAQGGLAVWDLAHSAGAFPVNLNQDQADFAVGCGYKYLNGGPGAPAFLFVPRRHQGAALPAMAGWMGHNQPFEFRPDYEAAPDIRRLTVGTPNVLSMAALDVALDLFADVDMGMVRKKSLELTDAFITLMEPLCAKFGFKLVTPKEHSRRGSQVSFSHPDGYAIMQAIIEAGVIGDFRAPNIVRFGFTPLYIGYADVWDAVERIEQVMETARYQAEQFQTKAKVT